MGEAKQEEGKAEPKPEEGKEDEKKEEKKEEEKPSPPPPIVLFADLHCVGCAKKIQRCIMKCKGVEGIEIDMAQNQVTVKGIVDPQALCLRIQKKTMRHAKVLSPLPPTESDSTQSEPVTSQEVSGMNTVQLLVNMHCEACAQQLRRKILNMRGVQTMETELDAGKVTVTGTMDTDKLVEYIYRRTKKLVRIIPQPETEEVKKEEGEKKAEEKPAEETKEEKEENIEKKDEEKKGGEEQKEGDGQATIITSEEDMRKKMMYWTPVYVIERVPPPQLFSDENPNACCIQ